MNRRIDQLILAYLRNDISEEDRQFLQEWIDQHENHKILFENLIDEDKRRNAVREYASFHTQAKWMELQKALHTSMHRKKVFLLRKISVAAGIILLFGCIWFLLKPDQKPNPKMAVNMADFIRPGGFRAVLIMENGTQITLDSSFVLGQQLVVGNDTLEYGQGDALKYAKNTVSSHLTWHTLKIPKGGEFKLILEDSTEVWLNSETELKYPVHFSSVERKVFLQGEAYFKVVADQERPFIVTTSRTTTKVLGTSFNVSAYPDEHTLHTTLEEGKVEVNDPLTGQTVFLVPGEQALLEDDHLAVRKVDTRLYTLWRMDRFVFSSENLEDVLKTLGRWYDIEFFFKTQTSKWKKFSGSLPKYAEIEKVLEIIEMTTDVKFQLKNGTIYIE